MQGIYIFILGVVLGGVVMFLVLRKSVVKKNSAVSGSVGNLASFNEARDKKEQENKNKILEFLERKSFGTAQDGQAQITNDDVQKLLNISDATAERYLDHLEKQGF